jgi:uncharacterized protein (TIGR02117 family)
MNYFRKAFKITLWGLGSFIAFLVVYVILAFSLSKISTTKENVMAKDTVSIYILTNGVHTDIVMPLKNEQIDWSKEVLFENTLSKDTSFNYLSLGWGDKGFYLETPTWADLKASTAFKAAFGLSSSAMHATFYKNMKEGNDCYRINISKEQYARLIDYVKKSFKYDDQSKLQFIKTDLVYGKNDAFYEGTGKYSLFHTCNTWANNSLKCCGQKAAWWTPFDSGIFCHYQK